MKTHHIGNLMFTLVLLTALGGLYLVHQNTSSLTGSATYDFQVDKLGNCCCTSETGVFTLAATKLESELSIIDCARTCGEHSSDRHPVYAQAEC